MSEAEKFGRHLNDEQLWRRRDGDLNAHEMPEVRSHLENCASCRQRAEAIERLVNAMQKIHYDVQPTLQEQMQLARVLEKQFISEAVPGVLVNASRRLVRWLAPAVAVLGILFALLRQESVSNETLTSLQAETPESNLLLAATDEQFQQAMWEMALTLDENQK
jgi:anti-sigma factor RsiW